MEIQPPSSPPRGGGRRPFRKKNPRNQQNFNRQPQREKPPERSNQYYDQINNYLNDELSYSRSDSDRLFVYKNAFDILLKEFQNVRPILERIKQNYDQVSSSLLSKQRDIRVDTSSLVSFTEDKFDEIVNNLRKSRTQDFKECKIEMNNLLEEMNLLRQQKSDLAKKLQKVISKRNEIKSVEDSQSDGIFNANIKITQCIDEIKTKDMMASDIKKEIQKLEEKISETQVSSQELLEQDELLYKKLEIIDRTENEQIAILQKIKDEKNDLDEKIVTAEKDIWELQKEKNYMEQKYKGIKQRKDRSDKMIRDSLRKFEDNDNDSIINIIRRVSVENKW